MPRYFIEVAYKGTAYAGFQVQQNANTIQAEVEKALLTYFRQVITLTGSSRTDAGVHAAQNFFHFDTAIKIAPDSSEKCCYHLNAILPFDIVVKSIRLVADAAHSRFDALSRTYQYQVYQHKNPFIFDSAYFQPYPLDLSLLQHAADIIKTTTQFQSFAKKNIQVFTYNCIISQSHWQHTTQGYIYSVTGNRFLRGMVRGLVGTMLLVGRGKLSLAAFQSIIDAGDSAKTDFSAVAKGLSLQQVIFPDTIYIEA